MRILIAGGTGVLGTPTVPGLLAAGHEVTAFARRAEARDALQAAGARAVAADLFDAAAVREAAHGHDVVINLATRIPVPPAAARLKAWEDNDRLRREASRTLAQAAIDAGARFVQESFAPTYRDGGDAWITEEHPLDPVAQTGTVADAEASAALVTSAGGVGVVLRFGLFYGPTDAKRWLDSAKRGLLMLPGPGDHYSSMIYVPDGAAAVVASLDLPAGAYNVVEDEPLRRTEHAQALADLLGKRRLRPLPAVLGRMPVLQALARSHRISNAKLREATSWAPTAPSVREGWRMILDEVGRRPV